MQRLLEEILGTELKQIIISGPKEKQETFKIKIRPVLVQGKVLFQKESFAGTKVFHENLTREQAMADIMTVMESGFKQLVAETENLNAHVLVSKKGKVTIKRSAILAGATKASALRGDCLDKPEEKRCLNGAQKQSGEEPIAKQMRVKSDGDSTRIKTLVSDLTPEQIDRLSHNRSKKYLLKEGVAVPFLVDLGVQTKEGKIVHARYDKFRQINRYLEFIEDILPNLPKDRTVKILDFGCGKSYLTFATYYYLHELKGYNLSVIGLDLKEDVIDHCNKLAKKYHYNGLSFEKGNIKDYTGENQVDMVITLHACDTATDYALEKAVKWGAKVILSVPCCQHEVNAQIQCEELESVLKYGIIKERMSALITDALRAEKLEACGYESQILEFIDMEHTPKNLMIRAIKRDNVSDKISEKQKEIEEVDAFLHIHPTLHKLI